jgi:cytosine/adenosine deaminase-related metal-dependent hydrolase
MKIITPKYILLNDDIKENLSVMFDKEIHEIDTFENLTKKFPDAEIINCDENSLLMPGLVNSHVHLEFSANIATLEYGSFMPWLHSVIKYRDNLLEECNEECMKKAIDHMLNSGITAFGAVSSHGLDLNAASKAYQKVVFFNELIGSQAVMADALFGDFKARLEASKSIKRDGFQSAIAIHSPYSVHPILVKKALEIAKSEDLKVTAHFMESSAEREWLDHSTGEFQEFFETFLKQDSPVTTAHEFLELLKEREVLLTHVVEATESELDELAQSKHTVIHCPVSNRLLGGDTLNLDQLDDRGIRWIVGTDGLSSNYGLNLFEEMKMALFMHTHRDLLPFAKKLIKSTTKDAADALGLNCGEITKGKDADMLILELCCEIKKEQIPVHILMHNNPIKMIFIDGKRVK